jgi:hypothetical protein
MAVQGVNSYIANQLNGNVSTKYGTDYVGSVQLLEKSGFSPFTDASPYSSTLNQVFDSFVQKTGLDSTATKLKDEYLGKNPSTQRALNLYSALENTFATKTPGEKSSIVGFLNTKIDDLFTAKDADGTKTLNQKESGFSDSYFLEVDKNNDAQISVDEMKNNFYGTYSQLNNVLDYFQSNRGVLLDTYG